MKCILNYGPDQLGLEMQLNTKFEKGVGNVIEYLNSIIIMKNYSKFSSF